MPLSTAAILDLTATLTHLDDRIRRLQDAIGAIDHETRRLDGPARGVLAHAAPSYWRGARAEQFREEFTRIEAAVVARSGTSVVGLLDEATTHLRSRCDVLVTEAIGCRQTLRAAYQTADG